MNPDDVERVVKDFKRRSGIQKLYLIGSHASGSSGAHSDIDLVLVDERFRDLPFYKRPVGLRRFWPKGVAVDFICLTPEEFESGRHQPTIARLAFDDGIPFS